MREVVALALAADLARRLAVAFEIGWHPGSRNWSAHAGGHGGVGLQRHSAPDWSSVPGARALKPRHCSGGPSRAFGRAAVRRRVAPAAFQYRRALAGAVAVSCRPAVNMGLAPAWAASDNRSMHTDTQVHRAAERRLFMGAGDFRRSTAEE